jgi:hypothetical protein
VSESPVFVDESGRRSRRYRRIGIAAGAACAVYAAVMVATLLSGNSHAPWLPVPGQGEDKEAGRVENPPRPADPAEPTGSGRLRPAEAPPAASTAPPSSAPAATPGASAAPEDPTPSAEPEPTATRTTPRTGSDPTVTPEASPDPPATGTPAPPITTAPLTDPPDPPAGDSAGVGSEPEHIP